MNGTDEKYEITNDPQADKAMAYLRTRIHQYTDAAVRYAGVNRDWANTRLAQLGAETLSGRASYQVNVPITGSYGRTIKASSRAEAARKFQEHIARVAQVGRITTAMDSYDSVYGVEFIAGADIVFASGPQDPETEDALPLTPDGLKLAIRDMLLEGVSRQGWGHMYASEAAADMGLEKLPAVVVKTVTVPVQGTTQVEVRVFEGDSTEDVEVAVKAALAKSGHVVVKAEEFGTPVEAAPVENDPSF